MTFRWMWIAVGLALSACGGDTAEDTDKVDTDTELPWETTGESAAPEQDLTGQVGSIVLGHWPPDAYYPDPGYYGYGLFTDQDGGIQNLAACLLIGGPCVDAYPAAGESISPTPNLDFIYQVDFYDVGPTVTAGTSNLQRDLSAGVPLYFGSPASFPHDSQGGLILDGDFAPVNLPDLFTHASEMEVLTPDPSATVDVGPGGSIDLTWTTGGAGDVYLEVGTTLTHLEDDGEHSLSVADLELEAPFDSRLLIVTRMTLSDVDAEGNQIRIQTRSDQWLYVSYEDTTGWTELIAGAEVGEACADAEALLPVAAGQYFGDTDGTVNDHDLGDGNPVTSYATAGREVVVPIALATGQTLTATYTQVDWDGSLYLLAAGCDLGSPLDGADDTLDGDPEELSYTAAADETVYLVLDTWTPGEGGRYSLVLDIL